MSIARQGTMRLPAVTAFLVATLVLGIVRDGGRAQAADPAPPEAAHRAVLPAIPAGRTVLDDEMQRIYQAVRTPFKYGIVLRGEEGKAVDCPSVFRASGHWYMVYVCMNKVGYETHIAQSADLLEWKPLGKILSFRDGGWDQWQADGGVALVDPAWDGTHELQPFEGRFWMSYIGGAKQGYEPDPLAIGMAWAKAPTEPREWTRLAENPVLSTKQEDVREFERKTLYKSNVIWDKVQSLGFPFVMYYNAKVKNGYERIGMAVSRDMTHWARYGDGPVVANGEAKANGMSGDPQVVKIGDTWVMFYFGAGWAPKAFDTFACSYDLIHWTKWSGPHLVEPSEPWDKTYAHKPWVLRHDGVVYHFYCAVGTEGRVIALATSKELRQAPAKP
jgi:predicted GH43/DUF377 family glycosyl hydrolase